jgi:transposase-like protein
MCDVKKGISANQLQRHIDVTYKTAWYVAHRIREGMREARDLQLGGKGTTVEIDEAYIGGQLRHRGSKVAKAAKTMVIGLAERDGRIHLQSMSNRRFESIKPVLDAKLAEDTKEVVTDGNPTYKSPCGTEALARQPWQGAERKRLDDDPDDRECIFTVQAGHSRQLPQTQSLASGPLHERVLLEIQSSSPAVVDLRPGLGQHAQPGSVAL